MDEPEVVPEGFGASVPDAEPVGVRREARETGEFGPRLTPQPEGG